MGNLRETLGMIVDRAKIVLEDEDMYGHLAREALQGIKAAAEQALAQEPAVPDWRSYSNTIQGSGDVFDILAGKKRPDGSIF